MSTAWFIVRQSRLVTCSQIGDVLLWTKILDCRLILRPWFHLLYHFLSIHPKSMITYGCFLVFTGLVYMRRWQWRDVTHTRASFKKACGERGWGFTSCGSFLTHNMLWKKYRRFINSRKTLWLLTVIFRNTNVKFQRYWVYRKVLVINSAESPSQNLQPGRVPSVTFLHWLVLGLLNCIAWVS